MSIAKQTANGREVTAVDGERGRIGVILLFAFGACEVPVKEMHKWLENQKVLTEEDMPNPPSDYSAFQCACSETNVGIWEGLSDKWVAEFEKQYKGTKVQMQYLTLPSPKKKDEYILERRIWLQDAKSAMTPEHPNVARLIFIEENDEIEIEMFPDFDDDDDSMHNKILKTINKEYQRQKGILSDVRHRQALYKILKDVSAVKFLGGMSTYFVPEDGLPKVEAFKDYINVIVRQYKQSYYPTAMRSIDVVDSEEMRANIASDVAMQVKAAYDKLLDDTLKYLKTQEDKKDTEKQQKNVEEAMEYRLKEVGKMNALKGQYEGLLERRIEVEKISFEGTVKVTGRAKALLDEMLEEMGIEQKK